MKTNILGKKTILKNFMDYQDTFYKQVDGQIKDNLNLDLHLKSHMFMIPLTVVLNQTILYVCEILEDLNEN